MTDATALTILPLTPERVPDLADLFGQGGDPKWCWCAYFRVRGRDWTNSTAAENRAVLEDAVAANGADGRAPGLVAYDGADAVGWTSVGPREDYERLAFSKVLAPVDDTPVWSIVCFVVGRRARGRGVAAALLDAAIDYARDHGATHARGLPGRGPGGRVGSRPRTPTTARCRCSSAPGSRSSSGARPTPPARSDRSSGSYCDAVPRPGLRHLSGLTPFPREA